MKFKFEVERLRDFPQAESLRSSGKVRVDCVQIGVISPFLARIYCVLTVSTSPKESGIFPRIGLVGQSEQGSIGCRRLPC